MPEMPDTGEYHCDVVFVGRGDDLVIPHRAAWLNNGRYSGLGSGVYAVTERKKRV